MVFFKMMVAKGALHDDEAVELEVYVRAWWRPRKRKRE
jgi:hypothetical protein